MCGKISHHASECNNYKGKEPRQQKPQENLTKTEIIAMVVFEANLVGNIVEWVVDTGATHHICSNRNIFATYESIGMVNMFTWEMLFV